MRLIYRDEAKRAVVEAAEWYAREAGLHRALHFLDIIDDEVEQVRSAPFRSPVIRGEVRRRNVRLYKYGIYYRVDADLVTILAVRHHSREPIDWSRHD